MSNMSLNPQPVEQRRLNPKESLTDPFASSITRAASTQTYYTIRILADPERVTNACRAYAYFRWVDDCVDRKEAECAERLDFLARQQMLINACYRGKPAPPISPHEEMLVRLIASDDEPNSGLQAYIRHMMAVMVFDARRRGRVISEHELKDYSLHLAIAVTEALHYFIGHDAAAPRDERRYLAVTGAHITHMLRDTLEDIALGYFNTPCEFLKRCHIDPCDVESMAFRLWVRVRVEFAREYFAAGKRYLAEVESRRFRLAGSAYIARFEQVLNCIERDDYHLRAQYGRSNPGGMVTTALSALSLYLGLRGAL